MFTVKWIGEDGDEMIYNARDVSFTPGRGAGTEAAIEARKAAVSFYIICHRPEMDGVSIPGAADSHCVLDNGRVYVMNAHGKTVADYILSTKEFPHGLMPRQAA